MLCPKSLSVRYILGTDVRVIWLLGSRRIAVGPVRCKSHIAKQADDANVFCGSFGSKTKTAAGLPVATGGVVHFTFIDCIISNRWSMKGTLGTSHLYWNLQDDLCDA